MPSPFPGMDPYLEGSMGTSIHFAFSAEIVRQLAPKLLPRYLVLPNERLTPVPHVTIEIRDAARRRLVTAIEVLSPTNKSAEGREEYLAKRRRILLSTAHLLEIDLLRHGHRVPMQHELPPSPYFIFLSRVEKRPLTDVWPIALDEPLPAVPVPLLAGDEDVTLHVQEAFAATYDLLGLKFAVDYSKPSERPLKGQAVRFAEQRLRAAGLRA
ncbi:MAG: DUF4058 family protein [Planctomycetes bacterium]|nr:DUF4058 family protein [Planctomycetota bacterium]